MASTPSASYVRSLACATKRLRISSPSTTCPFAAQQKRYAQTLPKSIEDELAQLRLPRAVQATHMAPMRREPTHDIKVCDLQLRSYSLRNLEVFADFAMRAAYYLKLPASGPRPLPRIVERWTVPRSNFVHKKSQENFERITLRRQVQIKDGHPETVALWLGFLQQYRYYGVGMKANTWDFSGLDVTSEMEQQAKEIPPDLLSPLNMGRREKNMSKVLRKIDIEPFKGRWGAFGPMGATTDVRTARTRIRKEVVGGEQEAEKKKMDASQAESKASTSEDASDAVDSPKPDESREAKDSAEATNSSGVKE